MDGNSISNERFISAPPEKIFDILARPSRHHEIDGSGTVRKPSASSPERVKLGDEFRMAMKIGAPYMMVNKVIEFEEGKLIAWQPRAPWFIGNFIGGRIWRYELEPKDGGTLVRETWDVSQEKHRKAVDNDIVTTRVTAALESTLKRLEEVVGQTS
ncbi:MAG: dimethyladenosine transferase [Acidimicrobiales bacterium]|nr:dimethyladenosine transferase [Acidimicrobiales bacterium]